MKLPPATRQSAGRPCGTHDQLGFVVDDIEQHVHRLRGRGLRFAEYPLTQDGIADLGPCAGGVVHRRPGDLLNIIAGSSPLWSG